MKRIGIFFKNNWKVFLFIIIHLIASILVFCVVKNNYNAENQFYLSLLESNTIIVELSTLIITIMTTYEFLIKQLHFSRYSEKIVGNRMKIMYAYEFVFLLFSIVLFCLFNNQDDCSVAIVAVLMSSLVVFLLLFLLSLYGNGLDKLISKKASSIRKNINKNKFEHKTSAFFRLYKESIFKEEYELAKHLIIGYTSIVSEMLINKSRILFSEKMSPEVFNDKMKSLIGKYVIFIIKDKNAFATEINKFVFIKLLSLYKKTKKIDKDAASNIMTVISESLILDSTLYEVEPLFRTYSVNTFDDDNDPTIEEVDECFSIFSDLLNSGRIAEPCIDIFYILNYLKNSKTPNKQFIPKLIKLSETCLIYYKFEGLFNFVKELDSYCFKEKEYDLCVESYNRVIKYSTFYSNEDKIKTILVLLEELINNKERNDYISKYYEMYFEVVGKSFKKIDFIPSMIIPDFALKDFDIVYDDLCRISYNSILDENDSYIHHILRTINKKTLESDEVFIEKIIDYYDDVFDMVAQTSNITILNLVMSMYIDFYEELDKNRKLSDKNSHILIEKALNALNYFMERQNKNSYLLERIFIDMTSKDKDYHFIKDNLDFLVENLYKKSYQAIEYCDSKVIKFISNLMAWETKKRLDDGSSPTIIFQYGLDLLKTLIMVNYSEEVIVFVGTFITTIWAYSKTSSDDHKLKINKLRFNPYKNIADDMVGYLLKSIALRKNIASEWSEILAAKDYSLALKNVENELIAKVKK